MNTLMHTEDFCLRVVLIMNDIQVFNNNLFGQVRVVLHNNKPYFIGLDVAEALDSVEEKGSDFSGMTVSNVVDAIHRYSREAEDGCENVHNKINALKTKESEVS